MSGRVSEIHRALKGLNTVAKTKIDELTELARRCSSSAEEFISLTDTQLHVVPPNQKLGYIYLMDSILKNVPQPYTEIISLHISDSFMHIFTTVDENVRISLYKLFTTWLFYLPADLLQELSDRVRYNNQNWPVLDIQSLVIHPERLNGSQYGPHNVNALPRNASTNNNPPPPPQLSSSATTSTNPNFYTNGNRKRPMEQPATVIDPRNINVLKPPSHFASNVPLINANNTNNRPTMGDMYGGGHFPNGRIVDNQHMSPPNQGHVNPSFLPPHLRQLAYNGHNIVNSMTGVTNVNRPVVAPIQQNTGNILKSIVSSLKKGAPNGLNQKAFPTPIGSIGSIGPIGGGNHLATPNFALLVLDKNALRSYDELIVRYHLSGKMCASCGRRFPQNASQEYSQHLDWHFQVNRRRFSNKLSQRRWFKSTNTLMDIDDDPTAVTSVDSVDTSNKDDTTKQPKLENITETESIKDECFTKSNPMQENTNQAQNYASGKITFADDPEINQRSKFPSCMAIFDRPDDDCCAVCKEKFDQFWNEELEEWHYEQAVRIDGVAYHVSCQPSKIKPETENAIDKVAETRKNMDFTKLSSMDLSVFLKPKK